MALLRGGLLSPYGGFQGFWVYTLRSTHFVGHFGIVVNALYYIPQLILPTSSVQTRRVVSLPLTCFPGFRKVVVENSLAGHPRLHAVPGRVPHFVVFDILEAQVADWYLEVSSPSQARAYDCSNPNEKYKQFTALSELALVVA
jgi:hypothetical protein